MSLRDIIDGARQEAAEVEKSRTPQDKAKKIDGKDDKQRTRRVFGKAAHAKSSKTSDAEKTPYDAFRAQPKSAARMQPSTEAAASVRTGSGTSQPSGLKALFGGQKDADQKAREKEARRRSRERDDWRARAYDVVLQQMPSYRRARHVWWALLLPGVVLAVICLVLLQLYGQNGQSMQYMPEHIAIISTVMLVLSYVLIIAAVIFDFVRCRPLRKEAQKRLVGYSDKKIASILEEERRRKALKKLK